jgi:hypothetical protein
VREKIDDHDPNPGTRGLPERRKPRAERHTGPAKETPRAYPRTDERTDQEFHGHAATRHHEVVLAFDPAALDNGNADEKRDVSDDNNGEDHLNSLSARNGSQSRRPRPHSDDVASRCGCFRSSVSSYEYERVYYRMRGMINRFSMDGQLTPLGA